MKRIILSAAMALSLTACNSSLLSLWLVAGKSAGPATCSAGSTQLPASTETTTLTNTFNGLGTWELIEGEDAEGNAIFYLSGPQISGPQGAGNFEVLQGTFADDVYTFDSTVERTEKDQLDNPLRTEVRKIQNTIKLNVRGDSFDGTWVRTTTNTCTGSNCDTNFNQSNPNCTSTIDLRGSQVEAANQHAI